MFAASHSGHWLGGYSVIVAESREEAEKQLVAALQKEGLDTDRLNINELDLYTPSVHVLFNGDY